LVLAAAVLGLSSGQTVWGSVILWANYAPFENFSSGTVYNVPPDTVPVRGARPTLLAGETVNLFSGGELSGFDADAGSVVNVYGGLITPGSQLDGETNVHSGTISGPTDYGPLAVVTVSGGSIGGGYLRGTMNLHGGTQGGGLDTFAGSVLNMSGGSLGPQVFVRGEMNLSGGAVGGNFALGDGATLSIRATMALLNGSPIAGLLPHQPRVINERENATLSGVLRDGTPFDFQLNTDFTPWLGNGSDLFTSASTVSVTLVPETGGLGLASMAVVGGALAFRSRRHRWSA
jgi:hypothetical protein